MFLLLFVFPYCLSGGASFTDKFSEFDDSLWKAENDTFFCSTERLNACTYVTIDNLHFIRRHYTSGVRLEQNHMLVIGLNNDCPNDDLCCRETDLYGRRCTAYTAGQLTSKSTYGYGAYLFLSRSVASAQHLEEEIPSYALSCFALHSDDSYDNRVQIEFCFSNRNTHQAQVIWRNGENIWKQAVEIPYDASDIVAVYGIDWRRKSITFFVNHNAIAQIVAEDVIPEVPMRIKIYLVPLREDVGYSPGVVEMVIIIYRVAFKKFSHYKDPHPELFRKMDDHLDLQFIFVLLVVILAIFALMLTSTDFSNRYFLLEDEPP